MRNILRVAIGALIASFLAVGIAAAPAQAATSISCRTTVALSNGGKTAKATIKSNKVIYKGQTSFIFTWQNANRTLGSVKYVGGYGSTMTVGGRYWVKVETWHAGTKCSTWYKPGIA